MADRTYTVQEVEALRRCIENKYLWGYYGGPRGDGAQWSRPSREAELAAIVEERVRTHILAGHTAEDLVASEGGTRVPGFMRPGEVRQ